MATTQLTPPGHLFVKRIRGMGRGVFTSRRSPKGAVIEVCPVLILEAKDYHAIRDTVLWRYVYSWGKNDEQAAIALGYGSLYNHSANPNAEFNKHKRSGTVIIRAIRDIAAGEQIFINYSWDEEDYDFPRERASSPR